MRCSPWGLGCGCRGDWDFLPPHQEVECLFGGISIYFWIFEKKKTEIGMLCLVGSSFWFELDRFGRSALGDVVNLICLDMSWCVNQILHGCSAGILSRMLVGWHLVVFWMLCLMGYFQSSFLIMSFRLCQLMLAVSLVLGMISLSHSLHRSGLRPPCPSAHHTPPEASPHHLMSHQHPLLSPAKGVFRLA